MPGRFGGVAKDFNGNPLTGVVGTEWRGYYPTRDTIAATRTNWA